MSLMNGVDSEEIISEKVDASHILHSLIKVASHKEGTGYCFDPETTIGIIFGEISAPFESERVEEIKELFADTGLHFRATEYIREEMWSKYRLNLKVLQDSDHGSLHSALHLTLQEVQMLYLLYNRCLPCLLHPKA